MKEIRDLSFVYIDGIVTPLLLSLNEDQSYQVAIEKGRNYFGNMGTWSLDDPDYPTQLILHAQDELWNAIGHLGLRFGCSGASP